MSSSLENCDVRSISIGSKISLLFKESAILEGQSDLIGIVETVKNQGDKNSDFPEIWDLLDKIWIQIGENKRIAVFSAPDGGAFKYEEYEAITDTTIILEIFSEVVIVQDEENNIFEVYMNNIVKRSEG